MHGDERVDDWYWLRERDNPEVIAYLEAENAYADAVLAPSRPLRDRIFAEIKARVQETDESAPVPDGPWEYTTRTVEGQQYGDPLPATARRRRRRERGAARRERARRRPRLLRARRLRGLARPPRARVLDRRQRRRALHACASATSTPARTSPTSSTTSRTASRGPTTRARASTSGPTTRCARTKCGATRSARPRATTCSCSARTTNASTSSSSARAAGRFVLIDASSKTDVRGLVRPDRRARPPNRASSRRASTGTSTRSSTTGATTRGDRFLIVTNQSGDARNFELVAAPVRRSRTRSTGLDARPAPRRRAARRASTRSRDHLVLSERAERARSRLA